MEILIPGRFNGPAESANGGYAAGSLAQFLDGPAAVRLHAPPPLDRPLRIEDEEGVLAAYDGEVLVMTAEAAELEMELPEPVSVQEALGAAAGFPGWEFHGAPTCFVCGPDREPPEGLRIFPGPVGREGTVAALWQPSDAVGDERGFVPELVMWGVLDCPGAWAGRAADPEGMPYFPALGSMTASLDEPVSVGEQLVVMSWYQATEGRKIRTEAVVYSEDGTVKGRARHIEIKVSGEWAT